MIQCASGNATTIGLMLSGGLDSALLLMKLVQDGYRVQPFYVAAGCQWEIEERAAIDRLLADLSSLDVSPIVDFAMPSEDLYGCHWSLTGLDVPDETTADEAVFLPGRNPLLLLKPALWCGTHGIGQLAVATLADNPFPDATSEFCRHFQAVIEIATGKPLEIVRPFAEKRKAEILSLEFGSAHQLTFSCLDPQNGLHCGGCNKCAERNRALQTLPGGDPTQYANASLVSFD